MADVTLEKFIEFLRAKKVESPCPLCGNKQWNFATEPSATSGIMRAGKGDEFNIPGEVMPIIVINCTNCGYVRAHSKFVFDEWIKEHNLEESKSSSDQAK
jgi:hypothetical protein